MSLSEIKDMSPNQDVVAILERMLDRAKSGELRSALVVQGYSDDTVCHSWALDWRNSPRRMLAELVMTQHDFVVNLEMKERDSVLSMALDEI